MSRSTSHASIPPSLEEDVSYTAASDIETPLFMKLILYLVVIGLLCFLVVAGFTDIALILAQETALSLLNVRRHAIDYVLTVPFNETSLND
jgi:hypothetical protein